MLSPPKQPHERCSSEHQQQGNQGDIDSSNAANQFFASVIAEVPGLPAQSPADVSNVPGAYAEVGPVPDHPHQPMRASGPRASHTTTTTTSTTSGGADSGLVEAHPVDAAADLELALPAQHVRKTSSTRGSRPVQILSGIGTVVIVVTCFILILHFTVQNQDKDTTNTDLLNNTEDPMPNLDISPEDYLKTMIPTDEYHSNPSQNEHALLALDWLAQDPNLLNYTHSSIQQRFALATLYYSTKGRFWTHNDHWLSYRHHECQWYSGSQFTLYGTHDDQKHHHTSPCSAGDEYYQRLWLQDNRLDGAIPDEVYMYVTSLQSIDLAFNDGLTGPMMSPQIQHVSNTLKQISLVSSCNLTGTLPTQIGTLTNLEILNVWNHRTHPGHLEGTLPTELARLTKLQQLALAGNRFSGRIPWDRWPTDTLSVLGLQGNRFTGSLPDHVGTLTQLEHLYLSDNALTGSLPSTLGNLTRLVHLHAHKNALQGSIPSTLGQLTQLQELVLAGNLLSGTVPSQVGQLPVLNVLFLSFNPELTGTLPEEIRQLPGLKLNDSMKRVDVVETGIRGVPQTNRSSFLNYYERDCGDWLAC